MTNTPSTDPMRLRRVKRRASLLTLPIFSLGLVAVPLTASHAADTNGTWTLLSSGNASGTWSDAVTGNWSGGTVADGSGFTADFSTLNITAASTISLGEPRTIGNLIFGDTDNTTVGRWILDNGGSASNILTLAGTTPTITVNNLGNGSLTNSTVAISAVISGSNGLTKNGTGTVASSSTFGKGVLVLSGANDYSGGTTISSGALAAANSSALGTGDVTVASGAQLQVRGVNIANTININGASALFSTAASGSELSGIVNLQSNSGINLATNSGNASMTLSGTLNLNGFILSANTVNVTPAITISAVINGSGGITHTGPGVLLISNDNSGTYSGTTTISGNGSILQLGNDGALGSGSLALGGNGFTDTVRSSDSTTRTLSNALVLNGSASTVYAFGAATTYTGDLVFTNANAINLGATTRTFNVLNSKTQFDGGFTGTGGITTKLTTSTGTLVLNGANTYTGATTINAGTLQLGNGGTTGSLAATTDGTTSTVIVNNGNFTINRSNVVVQGTDFTGGAISGTGSFTQAGSGVTTLNGANTYNGGTTVSAGTLLVNNLTGSGTGTGAVDVAAGATLGGSGTIAGATTISGTLSPGNSPGTLSFGSSLTLQSTATTLLQIASESLYDFVNVTGALTYDGVATVEFLNGFTPTAGQSYNLFDFGSQSGAFTTFTVAGTSLTATAEGFAGAVGGVNYTFAYSDGVLLAAIPEPSTYAAIAGALALGAVLIRRRRRAQA